VNTTLDVKRLNKKVVFRTRRFAVIDAQLIIRDRVVDKPYISQNDCAEILAITKTGSILLIKAYRPEFNDYSYELPSGTLNNNEKPELAAKRELEEETGYIPKTVKYMFGGYPLLGYSDGKLHFFLATNLEKTEQKLERDESIYVEEFKPQEVLKMLQRGQIRDLCVLSAMHYYYYVLNEGKKSVSYREPE
jgi:ADP-ribose pyrophosphatase